MNAVWLVGGAGAIFAIVVLLRSWQRRSGPEDMGAVSHQWISEHRPHGPVSPIDQELSAAPSS